MAEAMGQVCIWGGKDINVPKCICSSKTTYHGKRMHRENMSGSNRIVSEYDPKGSVGVAQSSNHSSDSPNPTIPMKSHLEQLETNLDRPKEKVLLLANLVSFHFLYWLIQSYCVIIMKYSLIIHVSEACITCAYGIPALLNNVSCPLQILLLCGPPGLGKTTLAHVAAKHCGYRVVEVCTNLPQY